MFEDELIDQMVDKKETLLKENLLGKRITDAFVDNLEVLCLVTEDGTEVRFSCEETELGFSAISIEVER